MGRKTKRESVRNQQVKCLLDLGYDFDTAWKYATEIADAAKSEQEEHRKIKNAEYQRTHRFHKKWIESNKEANKNPDYIDITFNFHKETIATLDFEAKKLMSSDFYNESLDSARRFVLLCLISQLEKQHEEEFITYEKNISASKVFIETQRSKGLSDSDIQKDINTVLAGMSIDEVIGYQFKTKS